MRYNLQHNLSGFRTILQLTGLSVSKESDNTIIFHLGSNDFIGCLYNNKNEDRIGEVVGVLCAHFEKFVLFVTTT